jgi:hypothetical protein
MLERIVAFFCLLFLTISAVAVEQPGPNAALLVDPTYSGGIGLVYTCVNNYYVANGGNDRNPGTQAQPFATIQHGDKVAGPGVCINVAPGTYTWRNRFVPTHGGNSSSITG